MNKIYANVTEDENVDEPNFQWVVLASEAEGREAALREEIDRQKSLYNQLEKALSRVHCMYGKRLLDLTGERQTVLVPDKEFVKYFEELKSLKRENSALQQRLTIAEGRISLLEKPCFEDWEIDTTAGRPILVYKQCSVIEDEQAYQIVRMIEAAKSAE